MQLQAVSSWTVKGYRLCGGGVAPPTQGVGGAIVLGVWCSGTDVIVCILMLSRLCCVSGNVCGLSVAVCWPLPSGLASGHCSMSHTSGSSCHTPLADMIKRAWLDILYLMDDSHVM